MIKKVTIPEHEEYQDEDGKCYKTMDEALRAKRQKFIESKCELRGHIPFHSVVHIFEEMINNPELMQEEPKEDYKNYHFRKLSIGEVLQEGDIYYAAGYPSYTRSSGAKVDGFTTYYRREKWS